MEGGARVVDPPAVRRGDGELGPGPLARPERVVDLDQAVGRLAWVVGQEAVPGRAGAGLQVERDDPPSSRGAGWPGRARSGAGLRARRSLPRPPSRWRSA